MTIKYASNGVPTEDMEEEAFSRWLDANKIFHSHLSNETYTTSWKQKNKMKRLGVHSGTPDHYCVVRNRMANANYLVFIEMKRQKGGAISDKQFICLERLNSCEGVIALVAEGAEEAIEIVRAVANDKHSIISEKIKKLNEKIEKRQKQLEKKKNESPF